MWLYIFLGILIILLTYILITFNSLTKSDNMVEEAFATMDVYLKKRWDLIPNIVEIVKGYAEHEKDTFMGVINLRTGIYDKMSREEKINKNENMRESISKLMMLAEKYPDLKANESFLDLSSQLSKVEEDIANSRKYYNAVVRNMNNKVQMFPSKIIAKGCGFREKRYFEASNSERENVKVKL